MCRNIRVLHHFEPPSTPDEIRAAALQYVRKVTGLPKAPAAQEAAFLAAIDAIAASTSALLHAMPHRGPARTREGEVVKARLKWKKREERIAAKVVAKE
jgi:hypothetical protein